MRRSPLPALRAYPSPGCYSPIAALFQTNADLLQFSLSQLRPEYPVSSRGHSKQVRIATACSLSVQRSFAFLVCS